MNTTLIKNKHLLSRASFGPTLSQITSLETLDTQRLWNSISKKRKFVPLNFINSPLIESYRAKAKTDVAIKNKLSKLKIELDRELNLLYLNQLIKSDDPLREKMSFFWHGHFANRISYAIYANQLINDIRENAVGNFKDLLLKVCQSTAMLQFLNNQQNKKGHPNENFARELMELFTLGRGNYTEKDIKESARSFTGWGYDSNGDFTFKIKNHDTGTKEFLGKKGNFNGNDIINIILEQKATAVFITTKIYQFFVNQIPDKIIIQQLANRFYDSSYNIKSLLEDIFTASWFFDKKNIGNRIKSPIELIAGLYRLFELELENPERIISYQSLLGQKLFSPPNVAGWPNGKAWIDSSSLLYRMRLPQILLGLKSMNIDPIEDNDLTMGNNVKRVEKLLAKSPAKVNWKLIEKNFKNKSIPNLILANSESFNTNILKRYSGSSIQSNIVNIVCAPEYQLG